MMIRKLMTSRVALVLVLPLLAIACTGEDEEGGADEVGDSDEGEDSDESDTDEGDTTETDTTETDTTETDTTEGDTTETDTGTELPPDLEDTCTQVCELYDACGLPVPGCLDLCVEGHTGFEGECLDAQFAMTQCLAELTCGELDALMNSFPGDPNAPCASEGAQLCPIGCEVFAVPNEPGCSVELTCGELPPHALECDDEQCICLIEGEQVGSCSLDEAICDMDVAAVNACCGWDLDEF